MPGQIEYCDPKDRVWYVSEVAQLRVVSPAIDGPNVALVIRFEREGEERFARWIGGEDWHAREALDRLFAEAESVGRSSDHRYRRRHSLTTTPVSALPRRRRSRCG